jgi:hypothetical protein
VLLTLLLPGCARASCEAFLPSTRVCDSAVEALALSKHLHRLQQSMDPLHIFSLYRLWSLFSFVCATHFSEFTFHDFFLPGCLRVWTYSVRVISMRQQRAADPPQGQARWQACHSHSIAFGAVVASSLEGDLDSAIEPEFPKGLRMQ